MKDSTHDNRWLRFAGMHTAACLALLIQLPGTLPAQAPLPDAPTPQAAAARPAIGACPLRNLGATASAAAAQTALAVADGQKTALGAAEFVAVSCPIYMPIVNWYSRFVNGPKVKPLTSREKGWLAIRNVADPFNAVTILATSAISVGSDSHSAYGPGMAGFGRSVGVSYTQDMTGEFFGTFLIPSLMHQDPHYHREPGASIPHRILHAAAQVVWTQGDDGRGMLNYSNIFGGAIDDEISNLYVPGRDTRLSASVARYGTAFAFAPTDNFITEFLPDLARHIHVRVLIVQRIIDRVARIEPNSTQ